MDFYQTGFCSSAAFIQEQEDITEDVKRGPWTVEEDSLLMNYVISHGEGRWNSVAHKAGLKRTGKSCRLRWLNYLRPDLRRGDMTPQEQLLILELHSRWGNKWSKMAQYLPGRTDNEIKNYWRTRVQKQARLLNCDVNSKKFQDAMTYVWMPRLREQIASGKTQPLALMYPEPITMAITTFDHAVQMNQHQGFAVHGSTSFLPEMSVSHSDNSSLRLISDLFDGYIQSSSPNMGSVAHLTYDHAIQMIQPLLDAPESSSFIPEISSSTSNNSSLSHVTLVSDLSSEGYNRWVPVYEDCNTWLGGACDGGDNLLMSMDDWWSEENMRFLQEQLSDDGF